MVQGVSLYFDLAAPSSLILNGYTATYELTNLLSNATVIGNCAFDNAKTKIEVRLQTADLKTGKYRLRIFSTDASDGFIQLADEMEFSLY